jgi:prephenate dehydratase|uniref:prephenate dehydratase n=1 Tax=Candidatus Limnocylindrus sp. TaxID=2802978 RepID=UPI00404B4BE1
MSEAIAYAGESGAFAEDALLSYFGAAAPSLSVTSFGDVRVAVLDGRAIYGVLPIENLINGTVRETLDLLRDGALEIVGEVVVPVSLVLAALPGVTLEQVERVYSHAQALAQAEEYLRSRPWALLTTYNTAGAGAMIRERGEREAAAVLSPRAAGIHGLTPLTGPIEGVQGNRTRFWIVQRAGGPARHAEAGPARTTLLVGLRNEPGTLLAALAVIAKAGVNISKLESRPNRVGEWEYIFWLDLDGAAASPEILGVMQGLAEVTLERRILGSYPRGEAL